MKQTYKKYMLIVAILAVGGCIGSFVSQYVLGLIPCPLCIFQRVAIIATAVVAIIGLGFRLWSPIPKFINSVLVSVPSLFGLLVALRHIHLQSLPPSEVPECGPGLNFMIKNLPFSEMLSKVLLGSGECAEVEKVMFLPIPWWSAMLFSAILFITWYAFFRSKREHPFGY